MQKYIEHSKSSVRSYKAGLREGEFWYEQILGAAGGQKEWIRERIIMGEYLGDTSLSRRIW